MSSRVFVVHDRSAGVDGRPVNLSAALSYGRLVPIFQERDWPGMNSEQGCRQIERRLRTYDPEKDFLLWAGGDPMALVMLGAWLFGNGIDQSRWLRHNRKRDAQGNRTDEYEYTISTQRFDFAELE